MLVLLGEVGGADEYDVCDALKSGRITKPVVAWCIGTCASIFPFEVMPRLQDSTQQFLCVGMLHLQFDGCLQLMTTRMLRLRHCASCLRHSPPLQATPTPLCYQPVFVIVRCNSVTLELVRAARARPRQTKTRPSLRLVLWSPSRSTSSRRRSRRCSTGEYATLRVLKIGCFT